MQGPDPSLCSLELNWLQNAASYTSLDVAPTWDEEDLNKGLSDPVSSKCIFMLLACIWFLTHCQSNISYNLVLNWRNEQYDKKKKCCILVGEDYISAGTTNTHGDAHQERTFKVRDWDLYLTAVFARSDLSSIDVANVLPISNTST